MNKRLSQTVLAMSLAWACAGSAQAQLLIVDHQAEPVKPAPVVTPTSTSTSTPAPVQPTSAASSTSTPTSGLLIVEGYDRPPPPASHPAAVVPAPSAAPVSILAPSVARPVPTATASAEGSVIEVGARPAQVAVREGWANGMPVTTALHQVLPPDFKLKAEGINPTTLVSWSGGRPWPEALATIARNAHLHVAILWQDKWVTVVPASRPVVTRVAPIVPSKSVPPAVVAKAEGEPRAPARVVAPVSVAETWVLDPKLSLHENVARWVKQAHWNNLVWEGADYPIYGPATFTGRFDAPDGPLARLIQGYAQSRQPLLVKLTTLDKVVHVYNQGYHPTEVVPVSAGELAPDIVTHSAPSAPPAVPSEASREGAALPAITIRDSTLSAHRH